MTISSETLQTLPLLQGLPSIYLETLATQLTPHTLATGQALVLQEAWGQGVYFLLEGWVRIARMTGAGSKTLAVLGSPSFFGEMAVMAETPRSMDVVSLSPVTVVVLPSGIFRELLQTEPGFGSQLSLQLAHRLRQTNQLLYLRQHPPTVRLIAVFIHLAELYGNLQGSDIALFHIPIGDLADLAGIPAPQAQRVIVQMQQKKALSSTADHWILHRFKQLQDAVQRS